MADSITAPGRAVPEALAYALEGAGERSSVDFDYLLKTAIRESSLDPTARAATSSATGLFQFIDSTWLQMMRDEGPRLGYADLARHIDARGAVDDLAVKRQILALRDDPAVSADLAAAYTRRNGEYLTARFGRSPSGGELYIAHVLGAEGATRLFAEGLDNPDQAAAPLFPDAAAANRPIFYDKGRARSIREVYGVLTGAFERASTQAVATGGQSGPVPGRFTPADMSFTSLFKTEAAPRPRALISADTAGGSALFTQLYGQGQPTALTPLKPPSVR